MRRWLHCYVSTKEHHVSAKEPYFSAEEPDISATHIHSHTTDQVRGIFIGKVVNICLGVSVNLVYKFKGKPGTTTVKHDFNHLGLTFYRGSLWVSVLRWRLLFLWIWGDDCIAMSLQKSPMSPQKSPTSPQKSLTSPQHTHTDEVRGIWGDDCIGGWDFWK